MDVPVPVMIFFVGLGVVQLLLCVRWIKNRLDTWTSWAELQILDTVKDLQAIKTEVEGISFEVSQMANTVQWLEQMRYDMESHAEEVKFFSRLDQKLERDKKKSSRLDQRLERDKKKS